jgi:hypothetical protein
MWTARDAFDRLKDWQDLDALKNALRQEVQAEKHADGDDEGKEITVDEKNKLLGDGKEVDNMVSNDENITTADVHREELKQIEPPSVTRKYATKTKIRYIRQLSVQEAGRINFSLRFKSECYVVELRECETKE